MDGARGTTKATGGVIATATPYPWPYHGNFDPATCALVACLDPQWRLSGDQSDAADELLAAVAQEVHASGAVIVAITSLPPRRLSTSPSTASPTPFNVATFEPDVELVSGGTSGFFGSPLDATLRRLGRSDLIVAGWGLEGPVHSTLRDANDRGYECVLVADASSSLDDGLIGAACSMVQFSGGIFGAVATSKEILDLLQHSY